MSLRVLVVTGDSVEPIPPGWTGPLQYLGMAEYVHVFDERDERVGGRPNLRLTYREAGDLIRSLRSALDDKRGEQCAPSPLEARPPEPTRNAPAFRVTSAELRTLLLGHVATLTAAGLSAHAKHAQFLADHVAPGEYELSAGILGYYAPLTVAPDGSAATASGAVN